MDYFFVTLLIGQLRQLQVILRKGKLYAQSIILLENISHAKIIIPLYSIIKGQLYSDDSFLNLFYCKIFLNIVTFRTMTSFSC